MKAVLVIDVEEKDIGRKVNYVSVQGGGLSYIVGTMGEDVRLRPLPCKKYMRQMPSDVLEMGIRKRDFIIHKVDVDNSYVEGWNDCLDEITGEEDADS